MSASIHFNHSNDASNWMHTKKADTYNHISQNYRREMPSFTSSVHTSSQYSEMQVERSFKPKTKIIGSHWNRLSGFPQGAKCAVFSIVARIVGVVEPLFKGIANIVGAPFFKNRCDFKTGVKQLAMDLPLNIIKLIFVMPIEVVADLIISPFAVMLDTDYAKARTHFEAQLIKRDDEYSFDEGLEFEDFGQQDRRPYSFQAELQDEDSSSH